MLGIIFSTAQEATPFVEQYADGRLDELEEGQHVRAGEALVTVTGRGKIKATLGTERFLQEYDLEVLVHAGGATALTDDLEIGTLVGATFVLEGDRVDLETPSYPRMPLECPFDFSTEGTLVTQDHTTEDPEERSYWERIADLRDTTGYAIAYVAAQHGTSCHIVKGVTDQRGAAPPGAAAQRKAHAAVATVLQEHLNTIANGPSTA